MVSESERIIDLYQRHAKAWAAERGTRLVEAAWLDRFRSLLPSGGAVLDIGCGSGEPIARYLIERGHAVIGVDSSPEMIDMCRDRFPDGDWRICDMRNLSMDRAFNGILAWNSYFHLCHDDQRRMFPIFRSHSAAGAALLFTSGPSHGEAIGELKVRTALPRKPRFR
jgi:SAM-dependent methyltransferase